MSETILENETKQKLKRPPKYCVIFYNDNETSMEFVVKVLIRFFNKNESEAETLMNAIHEEGKAVVGKNYDLDLANTKAKKTTICAQSENYPLKVEVQAQEGDS